MHGYTEPGVDVNKSEAWLTWPVPAVSAAPAEDWPLHVELSGGAAPHPLEVGLHHGVGVREVLVLRDGGQVLGENK